MTLKFSQLLGSALFITVFSGTAFAEMPPHGRPANLITLPRFSVSLGGSFGENSAQSHLALDVMFTRRAQLVINRTLDIVEVDDASLTGELDTDGDGSGIAFYYQLPTSEDVHITLAARYREDDLEDDQTILSGADTVDFLQERRFFDITVLGELANWARGGWQPYTGVGIRQIEIDTNISTSVGAPISDSGSTDFSTQFTLSLIHI